MRKILRRKACSDPLGLAGCGHTYEESVLKADQLRFCAIGFYEVFGWTCLSYRQDCCNTCTTPTLFLLILSVTASSQAQLFSISTRCSS